VAAVVAWFWYSDKLTTNQIVFCGVILVGVVIGLLPYVRATIEKGVAVTGVALGIGLAFWQPRRRASASPRPATACSSWFMRRRRPTSSPLPSSG